MLGPLNFKKSSALLSLGMLLGVSGCADIPDGSEAAEELAALSTSAVSGSSCDPANARGAVPAMHRALLDVIAFAEGTKGYGKDGYNVAFGHKIFSSCDQHPRISTAFSGGTSTAAGRYQFLYGTWSGLGLPNFWPENQDRGAMMLVRRRGVEVPTERPLSSAEFSSAMEKLSYEWASLPPYRYPGQRGPSLAAMRAEYCRYAGCDGAAAVGTDGCTVQERQNALAFGCQCVDHRASGGFCEGSGCTATEEKACASAGAACVDHQCSGGFTFGSGCTAHEEKVCASAGAACVDHKCSGGFTFGSGCTALEEKACASAGAACVDHKCSGGFTEGSGCTALEEKSCASAGAACVDHQCSGGFTEGSGCTARETADCRDAGRDCRNHACVAR